MKGREITKTADASAIVDFIAKVLPASDDTRRLSQLVGKEFHKITNARLVLIVLRKEEGYEICYPSPENYDVEESNEFLELIRQSLQVHEATELSVENDNGSQECQYENNLTIPLIYNDSIYGCILSLGLPDKDTLKATRETYDSLTTLLGQIFRNAGRIDLQGNLLRQRSRELNENQKIQRIKDLQLKDALMRAEKSEANALDIVHTAMDGYWRINLQGEFIDVNDIACNMLGYTRDEMLEMRISDVEAIETEEQTHLRIKQILGSGESRFESRIKCRDGHVIDVEVSVMLQPSRNSMMSFVRDITGRKKAEELLKDSEDYNRMLFEKSVIGLVVSDAEGKFVDANQAYANITGRSVKEILQLDYWKITPEKYWEQEKLIKEQRYKSGVYGPYEKEYIHKEGHLVPVRLKGLHIERNGLKYTLSSVQDITIQKQVEKGLIESEEKFRSLFDNAEVGMFRTRLDGSEILEFNDKYLKILGFTREEITGKPSVDLWADRLEREKMKKMLLSEGRVSEFECSILNRRGEARRCVTSVRLYREEGILEGSILDITDRKKAEETLNELYQFNNQVINTAQEGIIVYNHDMTYRLWNQYMENMTGLPAARVLGKHPHDLFPFLKEAGIIEIIQKALRGGTCMPVSFSFKTPGGNIAWVSDKTGPLRNSKGDIIGAMSIVRDITAAKQVEADLRNSEEIMRYIVWHDPNAIAVYDNDLYYIAVSKRYLHDYGVREEDIIGKHHYEVFPEMPQKWKDVHQRCLAGAIESSEDDYFERPDGSITYNRWECRPWHRIDGKIGGIITYTEVTTERKKAELKLKENERQLSSMVGNLPGFVYRCKNDKDWTMLYISGGCKAVTGYMPEDFINNNKIAFNSIICEEYRSLLFEGTGKDSPKKPSYQYEYQIITADNQKKWVWERGNYIFDENKNLLFLEGYIEDITERKEVQNDLLLAKEKAIESDRLKSAFLANMSHEIRTPMNGILGFAELLKEPRLTGHEQQEYIGIIEKSGIRMLNIINDIINISKVESGQMQVTVSETSVNEKIRYIHSFFKPEAALKGLDFSFNTPLPDTEAVIYTDREKVYAILTNLVKNALKFTKEGSIELGYERKGDVIEFYVRDTGRGIPRDQLSIIFERFRQVDDSLKRKYEGAGLGLAITKAYVKMLGGKIWVESRYREGSVFYFTLPWNTDPGSHHTLENPVIEEITENRVSNLKILVAEDDLISERLVMLGIKKYGREILNARTGAEAVEACRSHPDIDLILMDIQMPEMDGYEACRQIRQFNKTVVIIAQTAFALETDREVALEAGCTDYISKPIDKVLINSLINKYFNK